MRDFTGFSSLYAPYGSRNGFPHFVGAGGKFVKRGRGRALILAYRACGTLRAAGDVVYPVVIGVAIQWSVGVGVACLLGLPLKLGLIGVWIGFLLDENIRGVILTRRWHSLKWFGKSFT